MNRQPIAIAWDMPVVTFSGVVSAQAQPGEQVIITVKKPNGTSDTATAVTNASGAYLAPYSAATGTGYSAVATVAADAKYQAAKNPPVTFSVPVTALKIRALSWWSRITSWLARLPQKKKARTITLKVA